MKKKRFGIFGKAFLYTAVLLVIIFGATVTLFASQFGSAYEAGRKQQLAEALQPFFSQLEGKTDSQIVTIAKDFHDKNESLRFLIQDAKKQVLYSANETHPNIEQPESLPAGGNGDVFFNNMSYVYKLENGSEVHAFYTAEDSSFFTGVLKNSGWFLALILLVSVAGAFVCARNLSKPIQRLAAATEHMSKLEAVTSPVPRTDEIGQLSKTVFEMYEKLKETITRLEDEIVAKQKMEESQKNFFSAASHELKTPVAAVSALIEEMLEGVAEPGEYTHHLHECMKMIAAQKKLISEILEVVRLNEGWESHPETISLSKTVRKIVENHRALAVSKGIGIKIDISEHTLCFVDCKLFDRVLSNIVMNAIQNTVSGEQVKIWNEVQENEKIKLFVLNTGTQLDSSQLPNLFAPFYRLEKARSRKDGHSGLGLTIVKKLLDGAGIPFSLEKASNGVLFQMELPIL